MPFDVVVQNGTRTRGLPRAFFERAVSAVLVARKMEPARPGRSDGPSCTIQVGVVLIGSQRMRTLNRVWRHVDKATDVLSFPLEESQNGAYTERMLGDLFLCLSVCRQRAAAQGIPYTTYVAWATVHGTLHLTGMDHEPSAAQAAKMQRLEQRILTSLNF